MSGFISSSALSEVEFGQDLSQAEQEQFNTHADFYDKDLNSQYLEVYMYYAKRSRHEEAHDERPIPDSWWMVAFKTAIGKRKSINRVEARDADINRIVSVDPTAKEYGALNEQGESTLITICERHAAYRALRVASWQAVFYLMTSDVLGWFNAPYAFRELGYGPGSIMFVVLYVLAVLAGQILWKLFCSLDSSRFPVVCYADLGERLLGRYFRHLCNALQSGQLFFNVALLINSNGQVLADLANFSFCFLAVCTIWAVVGILGSQIRSLQNFAPIAGINIWFNIASIIMTLYGVFHYLPDPAQSGFTNLSLPKAVSAWIPSYDKGIYQQASGVQFAVFAYGGAMIFPEFLAEMRRPHDFWKSVIMAQTFCFCVYMTFGMLVYSQQGRYVAVLPILDFQSRALIIGNNAISLITTIIVAVLYGNIGAKVFYQNVVRTYLKAPPMLSTMGNLIFSVSVVVYWGLAWIVAVAVPNLGALATLVSAAFILQFTFTIPPLLYAIFWIQSDAMDGDVPWQPGRVPGEGRQDSWRDRSRWVRGFRKRWYLKVLLIALFLGALAEAGIGLWAGGEVAKTGFSTSNNKPFSCVAPNQ